MNRYFKIIVLLLLPLFVFGQKFRQEIQNYTDVTSLRNESLTPRKNDKVYIHTTKKLYAYDHTNSTSTDDGLNYIVQTAGSHRWVCLNCHLRVELSQDSILLQYDANDILVQRDTIRLLKGADKFHSNIVGTASYDPLLPLSGWVAPSNPIAGNTAEVKFTDGTIGNYTFDGTAWVQDFNTPTYKLKSCSGADLDKDAKVHQVQNLVTATGFGVVKLDGVDCLGNNDEFYNTAKRSYTASDVLGNNTNNGDHSRILSGQNVTINSGGTWSVAAGLGSQSNDFLQFIYGEANNGGAGAYYSTIAGGNVNNIYSPYSFIGTPTTSTINTLSNFSVILNGTSNNITNSRNAAIITADASNITNSTFAYIGATKLSDIIDGPYSSIISGLNQEINNSPYSAIFGGDNNIIQNGYNGNNFILNGTSNNILNIGNSSSLSGTFAANALSSFSHIENGRLNVILAGFSSSNGFENINTALGTKTHGVYLKANNTYSTIFGINNVTRTPSPVLGEIDFYQNNEDLFIISNGSNITADKTLGESNSFVHKKNGWTQVNTGVQIPKTNLQTTPLAAFHVETRDFLGNASSGVLLAPMTLAERNTIPAANLQNGLEIYCTDGIANDTTVGVKQVYQSSTGLWKNLW